MTWWSNTYNRPLKDPLLAEYSVEELAYEYYLKAEQQTYLMEKKEKADTMEEDKKWDDAERWADEMEEQEASTTSFQEHPDNEAWMKEELEKERQKFGEDFGEDLSVEFDGA